MNKAIVTWLREDNEAEAFTNVDGDSMIFIPWKQTGKILLHNDHKLSLEEAEALAATMNTRTRLNMADWTLCFGLDEDEENEYAPCGGSIDAYIESKRSNS